MSELLSVNIRKAGYGKKNVLSDVGFSCRAGEICAVLGENGSGKSTLLKAVCALIPFEGECRLCGDRIDAMRARERAGRISYLSAAGGPDIHISVSDAVLTGFYPVLPPLTGANAAQKARAQETLAALGIGEMGERDLQTLSGGQKQLALLARTLVRDTDLTVLDEPDSALDFEKRGQVLKLLRERIRSGSCGVLMTSHDVNGMLHAADRLILMKDGKMAADVNMKRAQKTEIEEALCLVYGRVELAEYKDRYFMTDAER